MRCRHEQKNWERALWILTQQWCGPQICCKHWIFDLINRFKPHRRSHFGWGPYRRRAANSSKQRCIPGPPSPFYHWTALSDAKLKIYIKQLRRKLSRVHLLHQLSLAFTPLTSLMATQNQLKGSLETYAQRHSTSQAAKATRIWSRFLSRALEKELQGLLDHTQMVSTAFAVVDSDMLNADSNKNDENSLEMTKTTEQWRRNVRQKLEAYEEQWANALFLISTQDVWNHTSP